VADNHHRDLQRDAGDRRTLDELAIEHACSGFEIRESS
jgi:hypothetical protein